jgi:hypothetical protein
MKKQKIKEEKKEKKIETITRLVSVFNPNKTNGIEILYYICIGEFDGEKFIIKYLIDLIKNDMEFVWTMPFKVSLGVCESNFNIENNKLAVCYCKDNIDITKRKLISYTKGILPYYENYLRNKKRETQKQKEILVKYEKTIKENFLMVEKINQLINNVEMKLIKFKADHYLIVNDSDIETGDFVYVNCPELETKDIRQVKDYNEDEEQLLFENGGQIHIDYCQKITHSTRPFGGSAIAISLQEVRELIGEYDPKLIDSMALRYRHDFGLLEENEKESIRTTMKQLWEEVVGNGFYKNDKKSEQKIEIEWEVEFVDGKLKLL